MRFVRLTPILLLLGCSNSPAPVPNNWWQEGSPPTSYSNDLTPTPFATPFDCPEANRQQAEDKASIEKQEKAIEELRKEMDVTNLKKERSEKKLREARSRLREYERKGPYFRDAVIEAKGTIEAIEGTLQSIEESLVAIQRMIKIDQDGLEFLQQKDGENKESIRKNCH
jgi:hypothetical protein